MTDVLGAAILGVAVVAISVPVIRFFDVTLWQCTQFGNCPWYLRWIIDHD